MRVALFLRLSCGLPLAALALGACGGDSEQGLFGTSTSGGAGASGAAGTTSAGASGQVGAGAAGAGATTGGSGKAGAAGKAGGLGGAGKAGAAGSGTGGIAGKAGASGGAGQSGGGKAGTAGSGGSEAVAGGGGSAGVAGGAGEAGASGGSGATGTGGAAGEAGAAGMGGAAGKGGQAGGAGGETAGTGGAGPTCGNGVIDPGEKCDGADLGQTTCASLLGGSTVGKISCRVDCSLDTSGCGLCGNGKIDPGEECENGPDVAPGRCDDKCRIKCPDGGKAFQGHCYAQDTKARNWDDARKECEGKKGHLVTITSKEENDFVDAQMVGNSAFGLWVGLSDGALEGTFVWTTQEPFTYQNWDNKEPNDFLNNEDCVVMGNKGKWSDTGCGVPRASICEIDEPLKK